MGAGIDVLEEAFIARDRREAVSLRVVGRPSYRSPGHHVDGGSLAVILVVRSATRWLRLYG